MEDPARFAAVLNGVVKRTFENDQQITPAFIKEQVFPQHEDVSVDGAAPACSLLYLFIYFAIVIYICLKNNNIIK
jgi:hypothetical protein